MITLGELKRRPGFDAQAWLRRGVRTELRENLIVALRSGERLWPGIHGYDDTVGPQLVNALLSRHHFILLGLRGQAKSRLLRHLPRWLDREVWAVEGCEIHDHPLAPLCARCKRMAREAGDDLPLESVAAEQRYFEKLATPDVTVADLIGDLDPIRAARGGLDLGDENTLHFGLLPRAHRGVFVLNELPDLAGKIQVALFNIMQEGDVQIKGFPVRLPLDLLLAFSANPEDYTARGKIVTPLKDRIGSEVRTHYPASLREGMAITAQEAGVERGAAVAIPAWVREVVEAITFAARADKRVDQRSGVSQRLPITCLENAVSNAERRGLPAGEPEIVVRVADVRRALPALTGKLELEYEGEMRGPETVALDLVRQAVARIFDGLFADADLSPVVAWFERGGTLLVDDDASAAALWNELQGVAGLAAALAPLGPPPRAAWQASAAEFVLEGLCAHRRLARDEERGFFAETPLRAPLAVDPPLRGGGGGGRPPRSRNPLN